MELLPFVANSTGEDATVMKRDHGGDEIRVDRCARLGDVAEDRQVIALQQVAQVGADRPSLSTDGVAPGATGLLAEKDVAAAIPAAPLELGDTASHQGFAVPRVRLGPGEQDAVQRHGAGTWV